VNISYPLSSSDMDLALPLNCELDENSYISSNKKVLVTSSPYIGQTPSTSLLLKYSVTSLPPIRVVDEAYTRTEKNDSMEINLTGRRIVNISHLFNEIKNLDNHEPFGCGFKNLILIGERKFGFKSIFHFKCSMYNIKKYISTESEELMNINTSAVAGVMNIGGDFSRKKLCVP
jgi:hypothetical protein